MKEKNISVPFSKFIKTQRRCVSLVRFYHELHKKNIAGNRDLIRSAIVLSVASMDAYFTDKFCDLIVNEIKDRDIGDSLLQLLEKAGLNMTEMLKLLKMKRPYRRIRTLIEAYLGRKTTQNLKAIDELYLCFGIKDFCVSIERRLNRKNLLKRVKFLVERRHKIVHNGDYNRHGNLSKIDFKKTLLYIEDLFHFVDGAEQFLNDRINKSVK